MAVLKSPQKMVARAYSHFSFAARRFNNFNPGLCIGSVYIRNILERWLKKKKK